MIVLAVYYVISGFANLLNIAAPIMAGRLAAHQFDSSDVSYVATTYLGNIVANIDGTVGFGFVIVALVFIWFGAIKKLVSRAITPVLFLIAALGFYGASVNQSKAFFETQERTEVYTILPNESAFWIPEVGDNKDSQAKLDSEDYLRANKVAVKRFVIPHRKLTNTGGYWGWDAYVPVGRLIIVDRTPFSREWVASSNRGTSSKNESFPCQSKEGLNVAAGVAIGASVSEDDSPKYLYKMGVVAPAGGRSDQQTIFTSVYYSRKLVDVMDDVGRKQIQTLVCHEISARPLDKVNEDANVIMDTVRKEAQAYFATFGVTIDFIGWADTFTFDNDVQKAINDKYAANALKDVLPILDALAQLKVQEGLGKGLETKGPPIVVTTEMIKTLVGLAHGPGALTMPK